MSVFIIPVAVRSKVFRITTVLPHMMVVYVVQHEHSVESMLGRNRVGGLPINPRGSEVENGHSLCFPSSIGSV